MISMQLSFCQVLQRLLCALWTLVAQVIPAQLQGWGIRSGETVPRLPTAVSCQANLGQGVIGSREEMGRNGGRMQRRVQAVEPRGSKLPIQKMVILAEYNRAGTGSAVRDERDKLNGRCGWYWQNEGTSAPWKSHCFPVAAWFVSLHLHKQRQVRLGS